MTEQNNQRYPYDNRPQRYVHPDVETVIEEVGNELHFSFDDAFIFRNVVNLFHVIRDKLAEHYGSFISVRFCSQVICRDMQVLTCPEQDTMFYDPLYVLRDPLQHVNITHKITLIKMAHRPDYTRNYKDGERMRRTIDGYNIPNSRRTIPREREDEQGQETTHEASQDE